MDVARRGLARGIVQGVGFRPCVAALARRLGLRGRVCNIGGAVEILLVGSAAQLDGFVARLPREAPAAASIEQLDWQPLTDLGVLATLGSEFEIGSSHVAAGALAIGPDLRVCAACLAEAELQADAQADAPNRRAGYAFTTCTACGPRFTIVASSPWDRPASAMAGFEPCPDCAREYEDPHDRRWHAEAIACPRCGPTLWLEDLHGRRLAAPGPETITAAAALLQRGQILALEGVGGFQLLVDARSEPAVSRLRARKHRPAQPLALMVRDLDHAAELVELDALARATLAGAAGPIVLLPRGPGAEIIAPGVAPEQPRLGIMLATTPAHAMLLAAFGGPLVATSGNVHEQPIAIDPRAARTSLAGVADAMLVHDRPILRRCDDSVVQLVAGEARVLRLGRGLAPARFDLQLGAAAGTTPTILAVGAHWQQAPVLATAGQAIAWPHVGDLDEPLTRAAMVESLADLCALTGARPQVIACDAHPDYASSMWARAQVGPRVEPVWHHHAHVASVLAEHGREQALGVAWDGVGLGEDHQAWGGEFLAVDRHGAKRLATLRPFGLPGGDAAARDGLRALAGLIAEAQLDAPAIADVDPRELARLLELSAHPRLSPRTSSMGRLFDAFACLLGIRRRSVHRAQAACALEHAAAAHGPAPAYPLDYHVGEVDELDWRPMLRAAMLQRDEPGLVAARLHASAVAMILAVVERHRPRTVALAGGCFANTILLADASAALRERGVDVLSPRRMPPGDGGLGLGQAWVVSRRARP